MVAKSTQHIKKRQFKSTLNWMNLEALSFVQSYFAFKSIIKQFRSHRCISQKDIIEKTICNHKKVFRYIKDTK